MREDNIEQNKRNRSQLDLDLRTDAEALADAEKKKLGDLTDREMGLLRAKNMEEDANERKGGLYGQRPH